MPPFLFFVYFSHSFLATFIPMFGRFGDSLNPDLILAVFSVAVGLLVAGFIVPMLHMFRKSKTIICSLLGITLLCIIIAATPLGFPYRPETSVQRFSVLVSWIQWYPRRNFEINLSYPYSTPSVPSTMSITMFAAPKLVTSSCHRTDAPTP